VLEEKFPRTTTAIGRSFQSAAQLYVSLRGAFVVDVGFGEASTETALPWLSAGKPLTAVAIAQLWERGKLDLDDRVAQHIAEFAAAGKEAITIRHLLTHTGGFRGVLGDYENQPWDAVIAAVCSAKLEPGWIVGRTAGYHLATSWYILGELVRRLDGRPIDLYVREMICSPIGMNQTDFGEHVRPGNSARGPARELGLFYENLRRLVSPQTLEAVTAKHRVGVYDKTFRHLMDWGLGFIVQSNQYRVETLPYSFGPHASPRTFGHGGSRTSIGYCDPEHGLVAAVILDRAKDEAQHHQRMLAINSAIYEDLNLVT
jgi:CubicO group peptidase (beta-lactamase class C family)